VFASARNITLCLKKLSATQGALGWKLLLKVLQAVGTHEAEVDVAFCAVAEASADVFPASVTRSQ
jgi:hypothetical protein